MRTSKPLMLIILDGWGVGTNNDHNAIELANLPTWQQLIRTCPHTELSASGLDVGLPPGQMGNSEVGHMTMGAGRVIYQDLTRINRAIEDKSFFANPTLLTAIQKAKKNNSAVHILGLLSPGGIHSHEDQIAALITMLTAHDLTGVYLHAFLDGRDTPPKSAQASLEKFSPYITSIMGRYYAMDRDKRMERTQAAIDLLVNAQASYHAQDPMLALESAYLRGETDEFVAPTIIKDVKVQANDIVICMNFRTDRMRQICHALIAAVPTLSSNKNLFTLTAYDQQLPANVIFAPQDTQETFSEIISAHNLTQLHIAETEKYAHVTFFFNAGKEEPVPGEDRILIPSPKVTTYDLEPAMSAEAITAVLLDAIQHKKYDVIVCNFANADMVGHTGNMLATITALEVLDKCLQKIVIALREVGAAALITSDHGNAETMWDATTQQAHTAHTTNLVPLIYIGTQSVKFKTDKIYGLQDIAPTMLGLLNINAPHSMTGTNIISKD